MCGRLDWFVFISSNSLTIHEELNHIIEASCHIFTPADLLTSVNVGGGCYNSLELEM